jgi:hypothetical protein
MQHKGCQTPTIAATLKLQKWKTFYGDNDWKVEDVKKVIDSYPRHNGILKK